MDDSGGSGGDGQSGSLAAASVLGVKGPLRFRLHHSSQKAHVVLRRVEISDDSSNDKPLVHFSLFAQKRIEVKPGKEILVTLASVDGRFKDRAILFEGDAADFEESSDDEGVAKTPKKDSSTGFPEVRVIPPRMRRTWSNRFEVSPGTRKSIHIHFNFAFGTRSI
jgi:hypothetical protein